MEKLQNFQGGRGYFVDDVMRLQSQLDRLKDERWKGLGAFVLSGCTVSGGAISAGLVYINEKSIYFEGASGLSFPCYMVQGGNAVVNSWSYDIEGVTKESIVKTTAQIVSTPPGSGEYITFTGAGGKDYFDIIDTVLGFTALANSVATLITNLNAEVLTRGNADSALDGRVDSLEGRADGFDGELADHENRLDFAEADIITLESALAGKANIAQPGWNAITPLNSAATGVYANYYNAEYMKDTLGYVHLRGHITTPNGTARIIGNLPAGFRPSKDIRSISAGNDDQALDVKSNGDIQTFAHSAAQVFFLENIPPFYVGF